MTYDRLRHVHATARNIILSCQMLKGVDWTRGASSDETGEFINDRRHDTDDLATAEVISSKLRHHWAASRHKILIDLDHRAVVLPSSTRGHGHLYIDHNVSWEQLEKLLDVMVECGLVEKGYAEASKKRQATFLRLPWIRKGHERDDAGWTPEEVEEFLGQPTPAADPFLQPQDPDDVPF